MSNFGAVVGSKTTLLETEILKSLSWCGPINKRTIIKTCFNHQVVCNRAPNKQHHHLYSGGLHMTQIMKYQFFMLQNNWSNRQFVYARLGDPLVFKSLNIQVYILIYFGYNKTVFCSLIHQRKTKLPLCAVRLLDVQRHAYLNG